VRPQIDLRALASARELRVFHIPEARLRGTGVIASFTALRQLSWRDAEGLEQGAVRGLGAASGLRRLDLHGCGALTAIDFTRSMDSLECLDMGRTHVSSLEPLEGAPRLETVLAEGAPITALPRYIPRLRLMDLTDTRVGPLDAHVFRERHPGAEFRRGWSYALRVALSGTDTVRVRAGGTCHRSPLEETTLIEETNLNAIQELIDALVSEESALTGRCKCCGNPTLEFLRGSELLASVGLHHGRTARWDGRNDATIPDRGRERLGRWLDARGVRSFLEESERAHDGEADETA